MVTINEKIVGLSVFYCHINAAKQDTKKPWWQTLYLCHALPVSGQLQEGRSIAVLAKRWHALPVGSICRGAGQSSSQAWCPPNNPSLPRHLCRQWWMGRGQETPRTHTNELPHYIWHKFQQAGLGLNLTLEGCLRSRRQNLGQWFNELDLTMDQGVGRAAPGRGVFALKQQISHLSHCM